MKTTLLSSLAFLKINWDSNKRSYLDNFIPLLSECIKNQESDIISCSDLQSCLQIQFALFIPQNIIKILLKRLRKKNIILLQNGVYYRNLSRIRGLNFQKEKKDVERIYNALVVEFCNFAKNKYDEKISEINAEKIIIGFIQYNQFILHDNTEKMFHKDIPELNKKEKIIISDFVNESNHSNPKITQYLNTIIIGYMLVSALFLPIIENSNKKFNKTKIYFDTSFLINALGYNGNEMRIPCQELLDLLYGSGAQLLFFDHTLKEIEGILYACVEKLRDNVMANGIFGRSIQFFVTQGYSSSDVQLLISQLERNINSLRIRKESKPTYDKHQYQINEELLAKRLKESVQYKREDPLLKDVDSISAIYRLRKGRVSSRLEDCFAIFVTTNINLNIASNDFFFEKEEKYFIPPSITDSALTTIVWLKTPSQKPDLPMKKLISDCYAAIQPNEELIQKWYQEINKLKNNKKYSEEDYYFMRYSFEIREAIIEVSLGDPDVITSGKVPEILEIARQKITEKYKIDLDNEIGKRENIENKFAAYKSKVDYIQETRLHNQRKRARNIANFCRNIIFIFVIIVLIFLFFLTLPDFFLPFSFEGIFHNISSYIISIIIILLFVLYIGNSVFGITVITSLNKFEIWIEGKITNFLISLSD